MYEWHDMTGVGWAMMVAFWSVLWIGGLVLVAWVVRQRPRGGPADGAKTARDLLDERLATGEIDLEEYRRRRGAIEGGTPAPS